jgi:hypothetical protein
VVELYKLFGDTLLRISDGVSSSIPVLNYLVSYKNAVAKYALQMKDAAQIKHTVPMIPKVVVKIAYSNHMRYKHCLGKNAVQINTRSIII